MIADRRDWVGQVKMLNGKAPEDIKGFYERFENNEKLSPEEELARKLEEEEALQAKKNKNKKLDKKDSKKKKGKKGKDDDDDDTAGKRRGNMNFGPSEIVQRFEE